MGSDSRRRRKNCERLLADIQIDRRTNGQRRPNTGNQLRGVNSKRSSTDTTGDSGVVLTKASSWRTEQVLGLGIPFRLIKMFDRVLKLQIYNCSSSVNKSSLNGYISYRFLIYIFHTAANCSSFCGKASNASFVNWHTWHKRKNVFKIKSFI